MSPSVIELIGPAGAGKSTIHAQLCQTAGIRAGETVHWRSYLRDAPALLPWIHVLPKRQHAVGSRELKRVLHLTTLHRLVTQAQGPQRIAFDEGPLYLLTRQLVLNPSALSDPAFSAWWHATVEHWAEALQLVVWLDASNACLSRRLRGRPGRPPIPDLHDAALLPFLERYRVAFVTVLAALVRGRTPPMVSIDTTQMPPAQAVSVIVAALPEL